MPLFRGELTAYTAGNGMEMDSHYTQFPDASVIIKAKQLARTENVSLWGICLKCCHPEAYFSYDTNSTVKNCNIYGHAVKAPDQEGKFTQCLSNFALSH